MTAPVPRGSTAVMARRLEPPDSLDFFPTPPWATRALVEHVIGDCWRNYECWEPACGQGHMSDVLREYFDRVVASDVFDYGYGEVASFVGDGPDVIRGRSDWIITNPPFASALEFAELALAQCRTGVALLVRSVWAEGADRYRCLFEHRPPTVIAQFCERVPMTKGRWDPKASTATSYAWFVWSNPLGRATGFKWIPPGCRQRLTKPDDVARFAGRSSE
jgi:hypothetical protein